MGLTMDLHCLIFCCGIKCSEFSFRVEKILHSFSELSTAARLAIALRVLVQVCNCNIRVVRICDHYNYQNYLILLDYLNRHKLQKGVKCHLLHFESFKIMVAYQTIHKFNSQ